MIMNKNHIPLKIKSFLKKNNINYQTIRPLKNDASNRAYYRLINKKKQSIVMDSSLEKESIPNFILVSKWLKKNGFSSPEIFYSDSSNGILHIEDFGLNKFSVIFKKDKKNKLNYYKKAINILTVLTEKKPPIFLSHYTEKTLFKELNLFLEWHLKLNLNDHKDIINQWNQLWLELFKKVKNNNLCLVLRDFHIDNIFYLEKRKTLRNIGLIDYQDALVGHSSYDLVSLLQDVRTFISKKDQKVLYNYYIKKMKINKKEFRLAYIILGTQRLLKIIGIFNRLYNRYGNNYYLKYLPRTWRLLYANMKHPALIHLKIWLNNNKNNSNEQKKH